tara:strand:+ start:625 stop:1335 length:711 start_codon:yes stop_codon:yes gene_type:complete
MVDPLKTFGSPRVLFAKVLRKLKLMIDLYLLKDNFTLEYQRWVRDRGDETLRLEYDSLTENSVVLDIGGYVGEFAETISMKYNCKVYLFEPHPEYYNICVDKFRNNIKVIPLNFGLSDITGTFKLSDSENGSSFLRKSLDDFDLLQCKVREFFEVMEELKIKHIDLIKINIEGAEYALLSHILERDKQNISDQYQIQFHDFVTNAKEKRKNIELALSKTHSRSWCYDFVWENWKIK